MELALDTSTDIASIAISNCGEVQAEMAWPSGQNHTVELLPNLIHLLQQAKIELKDINAIIVAKGPGSFNGLRVGMATAKGLAFALDISLVGISTLEMVAFPYANMGLPVCPVQNAGQGEIATALYQVINGHWQRLIAEHITMAEELCANTFTKTIFCGRFSHDVAQQIEKHLGKRAVVFKGLIRAGSLAELGWRKLKMGKSDNPATLQPLYLRPPSVTTKSRKEIKR